MIRPGDIVLLSSGSLLVHVMNFFQKDPVKWGHAVFVGKDNKIYSFEALANKMKIYDDGYAYLQKKKHYEIFRYNHLTQEKADFMCKAVEKFKDLPYGWRRFAMFSLNTLFGTKFFTRLCDDKMSQVCSSFAAWMYYAAYKIKFNGCDWRSVDPDDLDDHCSNHKDWTTVAEV